MKKITTYLAVLFCGMFLMQAGKINAQCTLNANLTYTQGSNGAVNFSSTSTGTVGGTTYSWGYGDATNGSGAITSHTYASNGTYNVVLYANNNFTATCADSVTVPIMVNTYPCTLTAGFTYTLGANGLVNFSSVSTGTDSGTTYSWTSGSTIGYGANLAHVFSNGNHTITLMAMNGFTTCVSTATQVIAVTSNSCNITANFSYANGINSTIYFDASISSPTTAITNYYWNFGDTTVAMGSGEWATHTYSANGIYYAILTVSNSTCADTIGMVINVNSSGCSLYSQFTYTVGNNGLVNFVSTTQGTIATTSYTWQYGDGSPDGSGNTSSHTYTALGSYTVSLTAVNNATCMGGTHNQTITVNTFSPQPCNLSASFNHTVGSGGVVNFADVSTGTSSLATYYWDFGDGYTSNLQSPSHTYSSAGGYNVLLTINNQSNPACINSTVQAINVTGISCVANSGFSMVPTSTAQVWNSMPASPWNIVAATWSWGDNSTSNTLYTSHSYSAAGVYSICLSVTVSCGSSSTSCDSTYIYRTTQAAQVIQVNVVQPVLIPEGIKNITLENSDWSVYPNPNNGQFEIKLNGTGNETTKIKVYNVIGKLVYETETMNDASIKKIDMNEVSNGIYFIKINASNNAYTKKIIVSK